MKSYRKLLIPIIISAFFVFTMAYGIITRFEPVVNIFSTGSFDTTDNPPEFQIKDVSQMFNERGYYKSSNFSFDENEIINDFNGNLIYEIPLYNYKVEGDLTFDVKLTYNGSVSHQIFLGIPATYNSAATPYKYNVNAPEWILSVNGIAVQIMNFETNFFTHTTVQSVNTIAADSLHLLIPGYHFDNRLTCASAIDPDRITILLGDGSTVSLINKSNPTGYTGIYASEDKNLYWKANVSFIGPAENEAYWPRRVELMKGDGVVYIFEERKIKFADFDVPNSSISFCRRPKTLLLKEIRDQFGNIIMIGYGTAPVGMQSYQNSRPLLNSIYSSGMNFYTLYGTGIFKIDSHSSINGPYSFYYAIPIDYNDGNRRHIAMVSKIKNPLNEDAIIAYETYTRQLTNTQNPEYTSQRLTLSFNNFKRISSFKNFLGGRRGYSYFGNNTISINLSNYEPGWGQFISSNSSGTYKGNGRDAFFVNMVSERRDTNTVEKSVQKFGYYYDYHNRSNFLTDAVDSTDEYITRKTIESKDGGTKNSTADSIKYVRYYRVYPLPYVNLVIGDKIDVSGITKLVEEKVTDWDEVTTKSRNTYSYEKGSLSHLGYDGSFFNDTKNQYLFRAF